MKPLLIVEAHGPSLAKERKLARERDLDHLRIHAAEGATPEQPGWIVSHHHSPDDRKPERYQFQDGHAMLAHVAQHASVPEDEAESEE